MISFGDVTRAVEFVKAKEFLFLNGKWKITNTLHNPYLLLKGDIYKDVFP